MYLLSYFISYMLAWIGVETYFKAKPSSKVDQYPPAFVMAFFWPIVVMILCVNAASTWLAQRIRERNNQ